MPAHSHLTIASSTPLWRLQPSGRAPPRLTVIVGRPVKSQILRDLLLQPGGCTADEIQAALRWRSVQALDRHARAAGLEVVTFWPCKEDPARYMGQKISRQRSQTGSLPRAVS